MSEKKKERKRELSRKTECKKRGECICLCVRMRETEKEKREKKKNRDGETKSKELYKKKAVCVCVCVHASAYVKITHVLHVPKIYLLKKACICSFFSLIPQPMSKCGYFDCQKTLICIENKSYNCPLLLELFLKNCFTFFN